MDDLKKDIISVTPWRGGRSWVYSITFDEALVELHEFAVPILEKFNCPGHLEVVVGQIGEVRKLFQSSYNGMRHMNAKELRALIEIGWGVGNHSWSHSLLNLANIDRELDEAKQVLEHELGEPITIYCAPGNNANMSDEILDACRALGYLAAMGIYESLNRPDDNDLLWLKRVYLHDNGPMTHDAEFDPYRKIMHAQVDQGWIIDYCHCPLEPVVHSRKDCSASQLRERLTAIRELGGDDVWMGRIEEVVDYRYTRRALRIKETGKTDTFELSITDLPASVQNRTITLNLPDDVIGVEINGKPAAIYSFNEQLLVDVDAAQANELTIFRQNIL